MKKYSALFRKEIKNMYRELLIVLAFQIGYMAYMLVISNDSGSVFRPSPLENFITDFFTISFFFYPALLVYSLYLEERTGTIYQMHSLPIKRVLLRIKFLVVLCTMVLIICVISIIVFLGYTMNIIHGTPAVSRHVILGLYNTTFISLCLVCTAWGFMQLVRKNRLVVGLATGIVGFGVYIWLRVFIKAYIDWFAFDSLIYHVKYTLVMGAIFSLIGFFVYEKFAEV